MKKLKNMRSKEPI